jgi:hypothetical protein
MTMRAAVKYILLTTLMIPGALCAQVAEMARSFPGTDGPASCEAHFTYEQDTSNILVFNFYDQSSGDITGYFWDFGDGSTATGPVLSHAFPAIGTYKVCLTITNDDTLNFCSDSVCVIIDLAPQPTYLIGGLLYAGNFPINNPFNTEDYGYAYLYRLLEGVVIPVDTVLFDTLGYYYFLNIPAGDYLVKAGLKTNSSHFSSYLPGYYKTESGWNEADTLSVTADYFMANVHMDPLADLLPGTGNIEGYVMADDPMASITRIRDCEVVLYDSSGLPVKCTYTDGSGAFLLDFLPEGKYSLKAEYTGLYSDIVQISLDAIHPALDSVEVRLHYSPQGIGSSGDAVSFGVNIFPNPASGELTIAIRSDKVQEIHYQLINSLGQTLLQKDLRIPAGNSLEKVCISGTHPGIYILRISNLRTGETVPERVVIR